MHKLIHGGPVYTDIKDIQKCQIQFYNKLYSEKKKKKKKDLPEENIETYFGENEKNLSDIESERLEVELQYSELANVLKSMKNGKKALDKTDL